MSQEFSIEKSKDLRYSFSPRGEFSGNDKIIHDPKTLKIVSMEMKNKNENNITIHVLTTDNKNLQCSIKSKNNMGLDKIRIIFSKSGSFINRSYKELLYYNFVK